jgi:cytochrome bd-type quinol oxidase subunit 1
MAFVKAFAIIFCAGVATGLAMAYRTMPDSFRNPL